MNPNGQSRDHEGENGGFSARKRGDPIGGKVRDRRRNRSRQSAEPSFVVSLEYDPTDDAEGRLLRAYEFLLADSVIENTQEKP